MYIMYVSKMYVSYNRFFERETVKIYNSKCMFRNRGKKSISGRTL